MSFQSKQLHRVATAMAALVEQCQPPSGFSDALQLRAMQRVGRVPVKGRYVKGRHLQDQMVIW